MHALVLLQDEATVLPDLLGPRKMPVMFPMMTFSFTTQLNGATVTPDQKVGLEVRIFLASFAACERGSP